MHLCPNLVGLQSPTHPGAASQSFGPAPEAARACPSEDSEGSGASEQTDDSTTEPCQQTRKNTAADRPPDAIIGGPKLAGTKKLAGTPPGTHEGTKVRLVADIEENATSGLRTNLHLCGHNSNTK